eukprot:2330804-Pyramimonas_sp.AAC.1
MTHPYRSASSTRTSRWRANISRRRIRAKAAVGARRPSARVVREGQAQGQAQNQNRGRRRRTGGEEDIGS